jgi:hypothetical protein
MTEAPPAFGRIFDVDDHVDPLFLDPKRGHLGETEELSAARQARRG